MFLSNASMEAKDKQQWRKAFETEQGEGRRQEKEAQLQFGQGQKRTEHTNTAEARGLEQKRGALYSSSRQMRPLLPTSPLIPHRIKADWELCARTGQAQDVADNSTHSVDYSPHGPGCSLTLLQWRRKCKWLWDSASSSLGWIHIWVNCLGHFYKLSGFMQLIKSTHAHRNGLGWYQER